MARSIKDIKAELARAFMSNEVIRLEYGLPDNMTFEKAFSPVSIESILMYVVASAMWVLEVMFDSHKAEIDTKIETLRPHTLRWYVSKARSYIDGADLVMTDGTVTADYYDLEAVKKVKGWSDADIEKKKIVEYAVATEDNTSVFLKVAKNDANGRPTPLTAGELERFEFYLSQIKDAGVAITVLNSPADKLKAEIVILYDPTALNDTSISNPSEGHTPAVGDDSYRVITLSADDPTREKGAIWEAVRKVITQLPFNGEYRNADLIAALLAVDGVKVADIESVKTAPAGATSDVDFSRVIGYSRPYSGYYDLTELKIKARPYKITE